MPSLPAAHSLFDRPRPVLRPFATAHCGGGFSFHGDSLSRSRGLKHCSLLGVNARRSGLSTTIEARVSEAILWMQSGHAQDVAAHFYVQLSNPKLLCRFRALVLLCTSSAAMGGFPSRPAGRPGPGQGPGPLQPGDVPGFFRSGDAWRRGPGQAAPGPGSRLVVRARPPPDPARVRGFRRQAGTAAGPPDSGTPGFAQTSPRQTTSFNEFLNTALTLWVAAPSFLSVLVCDVSSTMRGSLGA